MRPASAVADYVVVGAGSAGSIVATRLAAAGAEVIVVEAGGTDRRPDVPVGPGMLSLFATANWKYECAPDDSRGGVAERVRLRPHRRRQRLHQRDGVRTRAPVRLRRLGRDGM